MLRREHERQETLRRLEHLLALERDADELYRLAAEHLADPRYLETLSAFRVDARRRREGLERIVREQGGRIPSGLDLRGRLEEIRLLLAQLGGDDAILRALLTHAERTGKAYQQVQEHAPAELQPLLQRGLEEVRQRRDWFETAVQALESRPHRGVPPWNIPPPSGL